MAPKYLWLFATSFAFAFQAICFPHNLPSRRSHLRLAHKTRNPKLPFAHPSPASTNVLSPNSTSRSFFEKGPLTPNGIKAGIAGGDAYPYLKDHIGWWYDWSPVPSKSGTPISIPMLWGSGKADSTDAQRFAQFKEITRAATKAGGPTPAYVLGYEEPDCPPGSGSAGVSVAEGVKWWEELVVPLGKKGTVIGSPSMCKQADETWLKQFRDNISTSWDFTAIHVNKNSLDGVKKDIDHYWKTYGKPIWVTEFACVNDHNTFKPCTSQSEINQFINTVVPYFESDSRIYAYGYSNGLGLGDVWPLTSKDGRLSASGKTYLNAIRKHH